MKSKKEYQIHVICYRTSGQRIKSLNPVCNEDMETQETWIGLSTTPITKFFLKDNLENLRKGGVTEEEFREESYKGCFYEFHPEIVIHGDKEEIMEIADRIQESKLNKENNGYSFDIVWAIEEYKPTFREYKDPRKKK